MVVTFVVEVVEGVVVGVLGPVVVDVELGVVVCGLLESWLQLQSGRSWPW